VQEQPGAERRVVAGLLRRHGRSLPVHRSPRRTWYPDAWDLPGGRAEGEEAPTQAILRELYEELGILAEVAESPSLTSREPTSEWDIWALDPWQGEPTNRGVGEATVAGEQRGIETGGKRDVETVGERDVRPLRPGVGEQTSNLRHP
jgi:8-oxo-dGTP diphosphatase